MRGPLINRRNALLGLGAATLLPFLRPRSARADGAPKKRLVVWFTPCGTVESEFRPQGGETDFTVGKILAPLMPYRDKLLLFGPTKPDTADLGNVRDLRGINIGYDGSNPNASGEHASYSILTGAYPMMQGADRVSSAMSLDQYVAGKIGAGDFLSSIQLGVDAGSPELCYSGPGQKLPVESNPALAFQTLFGNLMGPSAADLQRKVRRQDVLHLVSKQAKALSTHLSGEDKQRIEAQQAALEDLAARLDKTFTCAPPVITPSDPNYWHESSWDDFTLLPDMADAQIRNLASAIGCGITHVASLQFGSCAANVRHDFLGAPEYLHQLSHDMYDFAKAAMVPEPTAKVIAVNTWYMEQLAKFIGLLSAMPESDGSTVMDNTLILVVNELSHGDWHTWQNMPFFLVGNAAGYFKTGRYLTFDKKYHNDLLVSVLNALGIDDTTFGEKALCTGPLPGLTA